MNSYVVGITGASGAFLALRLVKFLLESGHTVHLVSSRAGRLVIEEELERESGVRGVLPGVQHALLSEWNNGDFGAPFASGSAGVSGMVIVPCSMSTLGAVANGLSDNLLRRGADVMIKERKKLILVPRETPLSEIHLRNMLKVARAGGIVLPPVLTFYQHPGRDVGEQIDFVISRVLDHLGVPNQLYRRWGSESAHKQRG